MRRVPDFSVEELLLFQSWTEERQKLSQYSYWRCKETDPNRAIFEARITMYENLSDKIQRKLEAIEA